MVTMIMEALKSVRNAHFFTTERGYQGEFLAELRRFLPGVGLPGDAIVEQEYQKRLAAHGINVRPDLIIHIPTPVGQDRRRDNFVVFELNLQAGPAESRGDFENLDTVVGALDYPLAVFVNIASDRTQARHYRGPFRGRLHCFAVRIANGHLAFRHAHWLNGEGLKEEYEDVA